MGGHLLELINKQRMNLCFLNDLEPEGRKTAAFWPGTLDEESELLFHGISSAWSYVFHALTLPSARANIFHLSYGGQCLLTFLRGTMRTDCLLYYIVKGRASTL